MKTSNIKEVTRIKPWQGDKGTVYYHHLIMENGDKIDIGKKKEYKVGDELKYELTGEDDGQTEYKKAKTPSQQPNSSGGGGRNQAQIVAQFCMREANLYCCNHGFGSKEDGNSRETEEERLQYIESIGKGIAASVGNIEEYIKKNGIA